MNDEKLVYAIITRLNIKEPMSEMTPFCCSAYA